MRALAVCRTWVLGIVVALAAAPATAAVQEGAGDSMGSAFAAILQADGQKAISVLEGIPRDALAARKASLRDCMLERLHGAGSAAADRNADTEAFADRALARFRDYWRQTVMAPNDRDVSERELRRDLANLLGAPARADDDDLLDQVVRRIEAQGGYALSGRTGLLLDLMTWTQQKVVDETVELPEGSVNTTVFYLDGFTSRGWSNYLTCDRSGTGGWATSEGLFAIVPLYDSLTDETFRVSYLAHESQHFSDYQRFPGLEGWQLEYRAKLVELVYASDTIEGLLRRFSKNQSDLSSDAHSYANRAVLRALRERLGLAEGSDLTQVPREQLNNAALEELRTHSKRLSSR